MNFAPLRVALGKSTGDPEIDRMLNANSVFSDPGTVHALVAVGAALIIGGAMFLIVYLAKKRSISRRSVHSSGTSHADSPLKPRTNAYGLEESPSSFKLFGKHRKYRRHRPRNPTLAETGGLPPARDDTPAKPTV